MDVEAQLTLSQNGKLFANPKRIALLKAIQQTGSISQGAKLAGISYKAAHDAVKDMNSRAEAPLIDSEKGGKGGGGASLTRHGLRMVQMYELLETIQTMGLQALNDENVPLHSLLGIMSRMSLQTSARNQLFGMITDIQPHSLHDLVTISLDDQQTLTASITRGSTRRLKLDIGKDVVALIKGPAVCVTTQPLPSEKGFINQLKGVVESVSTDENATEVVIKISDNDAVYALMDHEAKAPATIKTGMTAYASFSPAQVIVATLT